MAIWIYFWLPGREEWIRHTILLLILCVALNQDKINFQIFVIHLNDKTLPTLVLKIPGTISIFFSSSKLGVLNNFYSAHGKNVRHHGQIYCPNSNFKCQLACSCPNHTLKLTICTINLTKCCGYSRYLNFKSHVWWCRQGG